MFGRLHYTPDEYYRMGWVDMMLVIEGFTEAETSELNKMRHLMWASIAAAGGKVTPQQLLPLPSDKSEKPISAMTKEQFLELAKKYKA